MINLKYKPVLQGSKVILRPFQADDIVAMEECLKDPEVLKLTGSTSVFDKELVYHWYNTRNEQTDRLDLAIVDKQRNLVVGEAVINEYEEEKHSMNYRILIGPKGRDLGFGSEATILIVDYIFQNTDLRQLTLGVYAFNPRAQRVYEKVGFLLDYIEKDDLEFEGEMIDSYNMVLSRENWLRRKDELTDYIKIKIYGGII
ncbi:MAG: family N-acetyltransferase [Herbinix sp.]|jgi:diamine N-acetyltransferase|nr:family N-acetyltransferase [Herbinix sp.]